MSIELRVANVDLAVTQEGDILRVEISAKGIDPVGLIKPAAPDSYGIAPTLRFDAGVEMIAGVALAIPDKTDKTKDVACRVGWCATTGTGDIVYSVLYKWLSLDTTVNGAEDGTVSSVVTVTSTSSGYNFTSITIPAPSASDRVLVCQIERNGTNIADTCAGDAHVVGILFDFTAGP